jgi:phytoene dehydrogenase-like protein
MNSDAGAIVVGSGPNGLAAAITLARAGVPVTVYEGAQTPGGGCRTEALTRPGFAHDVCSAVHPLVLASPFFASLDLAAHGVRLLDPVAAYAQPLDGQPAAIAYRSLARTVDELGSGGASWQRLMQPLIERADDIVAAVLDPLRRLPRHPIRAARFAPVALASAAAVSRRLTGEPARALFAGTAAHSMLALTRRPTAGFGVLLGMLGHTVGWPVVEGGSARLVEAMTATLDGLGGTIRTGQWITRLDELPPARAVLLDLAPAQLATLAAGRLSAAATRRLRRFRYGPGVCKVDWALSGPVPWADPRCHAAATVHVGGSFAEVAAAEADVAAGRHPDRPFVLVVQASGIDATRAPAGQHTLWAYCHVPAGSLVDMTARIEAQIERFAPGFRDLVLARSTLTAVDEQVLHPNYIGGDINVGAATVRQTLFRPTLRWDNYRTAAAGVYLCSAATPPGGGVHGMCGVHAARSALRREFGIGPPEFD